MVASSKENSTTTAFHTTSRNSSYVIPGMYDLTVEDSNWVLTSSFIIFTMQTGKSKLQFSISCFVESKKYLDPKRIWNA